MSSPADEFALDSILFASYTVEELSSLSAEADRMDRMPTEPDPPKAVRRSGPGLLRRGGVFPNRNHQIPVECVECGAEITGEYWSTKHGPKCPECNGPIQRF